MFIKDTSRVLGVKSFVYIDLGNEYHKSTISLILILSRTKVIYVSRSTKYTVQVLTSEVVLYIESPSKFHIDLACK